MAGDRGTAPLDPGAGRPVPPSAAPSAGAPPTRGLTATEAARRLAADGPNRVPEPRRASTARLLVAQLTHLLALLLWVAAVLAVLAGMPELAAAIAVIVVLNAVFAFWQEHRADRSTEQLRALLPTSTRVLRDGAPMAVDAADLVAGDVVLLSAGDRIAADMVVASGDGLHLDESLTTGESEPVPHDPGDDLLAGTFVVQGEGRAVVTATGARTTLAAISALSASAPGGRRARSPASCTASSARSPSSPPSPEWCWPPRRCCSASPAPRRSCSAWA